MVWIVLVRKTVDGQFLHRASHTVGVGRFCLDICCHIRNYQEAANANVMVSYNMYWGGYEMADIEFIGPRSGSSRTKLLASDTLNYGPTNDGQSRWYSSHQSKESYKTDINDGWGNLVSTLWFIDGKLDSCPQGIKAIRWRLMSLR